MPVFGSFSTEAAESAVRPTSASPRKLTSGHYKKNGRDGLITDIGSRLFDHLVGEHEEVMRNSEASALAVLRWMTRSNLVGCSTGMSAGFVPRTYGPTRRHAETGSAKLAPYENRPPATTSSRRVLTSGLVGCPWWAILELAWVRPPLRWWKTTAAKAGSRAKFLVFLESVIDGPLTTCR